MVRAPEGRHRQGAESAEQQGEEDEGIVCAVHRASAGQQDGRHCDAQDDGPADDRPGGRLRSGCSGRHPHWRGHRTGGNNPPPPRPTSLSGSSSSGSVPERAMTMTIVPSSLPRLHLAGQNPQFSQEIEEGTRRGSERSERSERGGDQAARNPQKTRAEVDEEQTIS